jgi:parvulin-like peptidyl-prolyl isomerase
MRANPAKEEQKAAFKQAVKIAKQVKNHPEQFAELANKYSQTNLAPNGGDMGFQPSTALAPEYFRAVKGKKPGYIVGPIRTQFGYHIIKVLGVKDFKDIDKIRYRKFAYDLKRDKIIDDYFKKQRQRAKIKIFKKNL